jgi:hypothetical protein
VGRPMSILMGRKGFGNSTVTLTHTLKNIEEITIQGYYYHSFRGS